jgi:hypothetical protein
VRPDGARVIVLDLAAASLAPGDYVIELVASRDLESARSLVAVRVVP